MRHPRRAPSRSTAPVAGVAVLLLALGAGLGQPPAAQADPGGHARPRHGAGDHVIPTRREVQAARAEATRKATQVSVIKTRLVVADQRLEAAAESAEVAAEAYNGAMWRLAQAKQQARAARRDASRARRAVAGQRDRVGALVAQSYQEGGDLSALRAIVGGGPDQVLDQYSAFQGASSSLQADYQRFAASDSVAAVLSRQAQQARREQVRRTEQAQAARQHAAAAAQAAQTQAAVVAAEKDRMIRELATAQHVSVTLARTRQQALEERARRRAEERARRAAIAQAQAQARARAQARAQAQARSRAAAQAKHPQGGSKPTTPAGSDPTPDPTPGPSPDPTPDPAPSPDPTPDPSPPATSGGAAAALRFAEDQLGEPYQWGAAGPGSWDCSGLMMGAWAAGGRSLPHYSAAQYAAGTPISVGDLRPGDLVFWSSNGSPSGIHHVAMYVGDGQIIHAPRTGRPVSINSMYYWIPPTFFARV